MILRGASVCSWCMDTVLNVAPPSWAVIVIQHGNGPLAQLVHTDQNAPSILVPPACLWSIDLSSPYPDMGYLFPSISRVILFLYGAFEHILECFCLFLCKSFPIMELGIKSEHPFLSIQLIRARCAILDGIGLFLLCVRGTVKKKNCFVCNPEQAIHMISIKPCRIYCYNYRESADKRKRARAQRQRLGFGNANF